MKRAIQTNISFDNFKRPRESISASSSAVNVSDRTPVQLPSTPALPPAPVGEEAVSEGDAASPPTAKDAGTTSDEDVNYDINNDWPDLWTAKQKEDFKCKNPWLGSKNKKMGKFR
ncbi:unnamed protein product [Arctogadus glacialis]